MENSLEPEVASPRAIRFPRPFEGAEGSLDLQTVDLNVRENAVAHHTEEYDITERLKNPQVVVRRGQAFVVDLAFHRGFNAKKDQIKLVFETGRMPAESKGTRVCLFGEKGAQSCGWSLEGFEIKNNKINARVKPSPAAIVAYYWFKIITVTVDKSGMRVENECPIEKIYVLFNPWCNEDHVFMKDATQRDEYVLNDVGKIWRGSHNAVKPCFWTFGQFDEDILETCMLLLDQSSLKYTQRASPIYVCRTISQMVNSPDDNGVLVGNWSGNYQGGSAPTEWTGSPSIIRKYYKTGKSVKYGQCWVFAGVSTTVLRALGIPSRVVTNFSSAHDTDTSCTVDLHFASDTGEPINEFNTDSVWNFHVWNDCWMRRPDLPDGHDGWQAIDATPQETSEGLYRAGPASVAAVKRGQVSLNYDTGFIFAEVNADKCYWLMTDKKDSVLNEIRDNEVGRMVLTKKPGKVPLRMDEDLMDVTENYKYGELSRAERLSVMNALRLGQSAALESYKNQKSDRADVTFELDLHERPLIGTDIHPCLKITNNSKQKRTVDASLRVCASTYVGAQGRKIKSHAEIVTVAPGKTVEVHCDVEPVDYMAKLMEDCSFLVTAICRVEETGQRFATTDDGRLIMPDIIIEVMDDAVLSKPLNVKLALLNPLPLLLTDCKFLLEGPGLVMDGDYHCGTVFPRGMAEVEVTLTPWKVGERTLVAHFESEQLHDVDGSATVVVKK